jgi:seryl-tRNA synthetase
MIQSQHSLKIESQEKSQSQVTDSTNHLTDWVDEKEKQKDTLKNGLLSFLKYVEKVEDEQLPRQK